MGIVGAGAIAQIAHLPVLRRMRGVEIAGICDADGPKARALAARFELRDAFTDIEDLFEFNRVDAAVICTPNHLHEAHVIAALAAGAHVLVERPLALSRAGAERVRKAAEQFDRRVMVAMNHRFRSDVQAARAFLRGGELGKLTGVRAGWYVLHPARHQLGWRARRAESGGGAMLDLALPLVDLALWIADFPGVERVSAFLDEPPGSELVEGAGGALLTCRNGLAIFVDVSWHHVGESERTWFEIHAERGSASLSPLRIFKEVHGSAVDVTPTGAVGREHLFTASYRAEWAHFLAVARGQIAPAPLSEQVQLVEVMEAMYRSHEDRRDVKL